MHVPFVDLASVHNALESQLSAAIARVGSTQRFILGAEVEGLERMLAREVGANFSIGVSSGSDALFLALAVLDIGSGDEVITTPFTFIATAEAVARRGAVPRFADVCADTFNLDATLAEAAISPRTRAILPVHLFGQPADLPALSALATRTGVPLVEDVAQSLGSAWEGKAAGSWGAAGCFSFFPTKVLGALGDAGMVVTSDPELAARCRRLRQHGSAGEEEYVEIGGNFRLDALQAALLHAKLPHLDGWIARRRAHAGRYVEQLSELEGIVLPRVARGAEPVWSLYTIRVLDGRRGALARFLAERAIETRVYYRRPLHLQPVFAQLGYREGSLPHAERAAREVLSLPIYPSLTPAQQDHVIDSIRAFFRA